MGKISATHNNLSLKMCCLQFKFQSFQLLIKKVTHPVQLLYIQLWMLKSQAVLPVQISTKVIWIISSVFNLLAIYLGNTFNAVWYARPKHCLGCTVWAAVYKSDESPIIYHYSIVETNMLYNMQTCDFVSNFLRIFPSIYWAINKGIYFYTINVDLIGDRWESDNQDIWNRCARLSQFCVNNLDQNILLWHML